MEDERANEEELAYRLGMTTPDDAGRVICPDYNEQNLREKALMYAVQAHAADPRMFITGNADAFLKFLKGDAA